MTSPSPSQLSSFGGSTLYGQPGGMTGNITIQQRGMSNPPFQRNVTPTSGQSMPPSFPLGLQQGQPGQQQQQPPQGQNSPNRNLFNMGPGQRSILGGGSQVTIGSQMRNSTPMSSGIISPNRIFPNAFSSLQQQLSNQRSAVITSSTGSTMPSMAPLKFGRTGTDFGGPLDLSDFPSLGNRSSSSNPVPSAPRSYVGMVSKAVPDPTPEFQIQNEDFPALPGAQNPPSSSPGDSARKSMLPQFTLMQSGGNSYDQALKDNQGKFPGDAKNGQQSKRGIQTMPDGTVTNIPQGMVTDQFGMVGLLTFIRAAETDPNLVPLAPGIDLTTLGLNLNSQENLYSTFQSPWADAPCRPQDIDFHVPSEYLTNIMLREKLAPLKLNRYQEDLLFFFFYLNGGDVLQLAAAAELYSRDWRYHKEERVWITRAPSVEPVVKTNTYERGTYYFFDVQNWRKVAKEFHLEYDKLEERPHLPTNLQTSTAQPPAPGVLAH